MTGNRFPVFSRGERHFDWAGSGFQQSRRLPPTPHMCSSAGVGGNHGERSATDPSPVGRSIDSFFPQPTNTEKDDLDE